MKLFPRIVAEEVTGYGGRVRVLPPEVAHRVAAGEVIERPASAVKDLVEDLLDARASRVEVEIEVGGVSLIRVRDEVLGSPDSVSCITPSRSSRTTASTHRKGRGSATNYEQYV